MTGTFESTAVLSEPALPAASAFSFCRASAVELLQNQQLLMNSSAGLRWCFSCSFINWREKAQSAPARIGNTGMLRHGRCASASAPESLAGARLQ
ncbi:hypothetical protein KCP75_19555 [Salmonella enterica subsp. enterica]|nr:hypothetical protein KCP75_19555 [Salmonella enterica subsp. enterica]